MGWGKEYRSKRSALEKTATILMGRAEVSCVVVNMSLSGARIRMKQEQLMPNNFTLLVDGKLTECELVWRNGCELGVRVRGLRIA